MPIYRPKDQNAATASVNNGIRDPFQGHDCTLWMLDAQGRQVNRGHFTSVQLTFRNATEPYMELNQRVPRYLDGDIQIGWVAQRGMLDMNALAESFGFSAVTREGRVSRGPRFTLVFYVDAPELVEAETSLSANPGLAEYRNALDNYYQATGIQQSNTNGRKAAGKITLLNCKLDTYAIGVQSGQKVVANQWEGLAEGYIIGTDTSQLAAERTAVTNTLAGQRPATNVVSNADLGIYNNLYNRG